MPLREIKEWLSEYKSLKQEEFHTYIATLRQREDWITAIANLFDSDITNEYVEPVCHQLFDFFKTGEAELRRFTLDLVPTLIYTYLSAVSRGDKRKCSGLEACLLGIYNLDVVSVSDGKPRSRTFTIPTLAVPSIYHEPPSLATLALTESALMRYHSDSPEIITEGPYLQLETINAENRMTVMRYVMYLYNTEIKQLHSRSHYMLCKVAARLAKQGFDNLDDIGVAMVTIDLNDSMSSTSSRSSRRSVRFNSCNDSRIALESSFLVEVLHSLYFTMFNGQPHLSIEAVNFIHKRASYEMFSDVILVSNAIRNSLQVNPSGQPQDGPMGISVALSAQRDEKLFKRAITNASFRGKKLPEDINILDTNVADMTDDSACHMTRESSAHDNLGAVKNIGKKTKKEKRSSFKKKIPSKKDIEVVNGDEHPDNPPTYDDLLDSDRGSMKDEKTPSSKISAKLPHLNNPLKSIMRKGTDKPEKGAGKVNKKESSESTFSRRSKHERSDSMSDTNSPKSPKHSSFGLSGSNSGGIGVGSSSLFSNGEVADPSSVQVHVFESGGKRTVVDQIDLASVSSHASLNYEKYDGKQQGYEHNNSTASHNGHHHDGFTGQSADMKLNLYQEELENVTEEETEIDTERPEFLNTQL